MGESGESGNRNTAPRRARSARRPLAAPSPSDAAAPTRQISAPPTDIPTPERVVTGPSASDVTVAVSHYELAEERGRYGERIQLFNAIAEQIWREQQLVSTRMQWNFTFQAFLAGIYVFAGSNLDDLARLSVQVILSVAGFLVALFCLWGVKAAQEQSTRLKKHWAFEFHKAPPDEVGDCAIGQGAFPQPFSTSKGSRRGRFASRGVCRVLMGMWGAMLLLAIAAQWFIPAKPGAGIIMCAIQAAASSGKTATITCTPVTPAEAVTDDAATGATRKGPHPSPTPTSLTSSGATKR